MDSLVSDANLIGLQASSGSNRSIRPKEKRSWESFRVSRGMDFAASEQVGKRWMQRNRRTNRALGMGRKLMARATLQPPLAEKD
jgi:hypothetical protein